MKSRPANPVIASALLLLSLINIAAAADCYTGGPGCLDPTFGSPTGKALVNTDGAVPANVDLDQARALAIQGDGKIVAAGITTNPANPTINKFVVVRVNPDGSVDPSFGGSGAVTTSFSTGSDSAYGVALQSDGKIVVAGTASSGSSHLFAVARYDQADGSLDPTFGTGGKVTIGFGSSSGNSSHGGSQQQTTEAQARSLAIQADGKIVVAGFTTSSSGALARLNPNGSLDTSFGSGGKATTSVGGSREAVAIQPDGKIVMGGSVSGKGNSGRNFAVIRYHSNGSVDSSFGTSGIATADFAGADDLVGALAIDGNGNIVVAGNTATAGLATHNFALARFTPAGVLDSTFGSGGKVTTNPGGWDDCWAVAIQSDGRILAAGYSYASGTGGQNYSTLIRYNANGSLDGSFGVGGIVTTIMAGGPDNWAYALVIQSDGKIVTGGTADTATASDGFFVALTRFIP